jgi:hypothetical protein
VSEDRVKNLVLMKNYGTYLMKNMKWLVFELERLFECFKIHVNCEVLAN